MWQSLTFGNAENIDCKSIDSSFFENNYTQTVWSFEHSVLPIHIYSHTNTCAQMLPN